VFRVLALPLAVLALQPYGSDVRPLSAPLQKSLEGRFWQPGCPVPLSQLRLLSVTHWGFEGRSHTGHRSPQRKGMVTPAVVRAFRSIGWGWGGSWSGETKDYMHFSTTGH
jgi:hypothetical protein